MAFNSRPIMKIVQGLQTYETIINAMLVVDGWPGKSDIRASIERKLSEMKYMIENEIPPNKAFHSLATEWYCRLSLLYSTFASDVFSYNQQSVNAETLSEESKENQSSSKQENFNTKSQQMFYFNQVEAQSSQSSECDNPLDLSVNATVANKQDIATPMENGGQFANIFFDQLGSTSNVQLWLNSLPKVASSKPEPRTSNKAKIEKRPKEHRCFWKGCHYSSARGYNLKRHVLSAHLNQPCIQQNKSNDNVEPDQPISMSTPVNFSIK